MKHSISRIGCMVLVFAIMSTILSACSVSVESLILSEESISVSAGLAKEITATVTERASNPNLKWISSNPDVATVAIKNNNTHIVVITGVTPGTATITATTRDGSNITASCEVTVTEASSELAVLEQIEITGALTETLASDPNHEIAKGALTFYADGSYILNAYYAELPLPVELASSYHIQDGQLLFDVTEFELVILGFPGTAIIAAKTQGDNIIVNVSVKGGEKNVANFVIDPELQAKMGLIAGKEPPAPEPVDPDQLLGTEHFEQMTRFTVNDPTFGTITLTFKPDGTADLAMLGQEGLYGPYGIITENGIRYITAIDSKNLTPDGKALETDVTRWELCTEGESLVLKGVGFGDMTEVK